MSTIPSALAKKLVEIMAAVQRVPKNGYNEFHQYHYALEADILDALRDELSKRNVLLIPAVTGRSRDGVGEKGMVVTHLDMEFTFMDAETGETLMRPWLGAGADKEDKGAYKAMTGGEKYFLLKMFLVPTGDDPEGEEGQQRKPAPSSPVTRPVTTPAAYPATRHAPAAETHSAPEGDGLLKVVGVKVGKKGTNAQGPWTLWVVTLSDGREATTFDDGIATKADHARKANARVSVAVTAKGDKLTLTNVHQVAA